MKVRFKIKEISLPKLNIQRTWGFLILILVLATCVLGLSLKREILDVFWGETDLSPILSRQTLKEFGVVALLIMAAFLALIMYKSYEVVTRKNQLRLIIMLVASFVINSLFTAVTLGGLVLIGKLVDSKYFVELITIGLFGFTLSFSLLTYHLLIETNLAKVEFKAAQERSVEKTLKVITYILAVSIIFFGVLAITPRGGTGFLNLFAIIMIVLSFLSGTIVPYEIYALLSINFKVPQAKGKRKQSKK